jgi:hypothetical protein
MTGKAREKSVDGVGLCANCEFMRRIQSDRGSAFYQCQLSATNPKFPKYPRLPALTCDGYRPLRDPSQ